MNYDLIELLKNKKCFKLVCGAGNEDVLEVRNLTYLYSSALANLFDISANIEILNAAKFGIKKGKEYIKNKKDFFISVSIGISGDPHIQKGEIIKEKCKNCGVCIGVCKNIAIYKTDNNYLINSKRCIGCGNCIKVCNNSAIKFYSYLKPLEDVLPPLIEQGIDCIELHAIGPDDEEVLEKWNILNKLYNGLLSVCLDRSYLSNKRLIERIKKLLKYRKEWTTIVQADGAPMSGGDDTFKSTLQAVSTAEIVANENLPVFILLSGGTNSKTKKLANLCDIKPNGIAIGSYARKIVRKYINDEDFIYNKEKFLYSLKIARKLVKQTI